MMWQRQPSQLFNETQMIRAARELIKAYGSHAAAVVESARLI